MRLTPKSLLARSKVIRRIYNGPPAQTSFEEIYATNLWGHGSGHGSLPSVTKSYRALVEQFVREHNVRTVIDYGCGDWQSSRLIDWNGADYLGIDVVPALIERNQRLYASERVRFQLGYRGEQGDMLIAKHVLQHLPNDAVQQFLSEVVPRFRYALITNDSTPVHTLNKDIAEAGYRALDVRLPPFGVDAVEVHRMGRNRPTFALRSRLRPLPPWASVVLLIDQQGH